LELWNPWDLLDAIMTRYDTSAVRFAIFLCASFWALLVIGTNIAANMIALGNDSTLLFPRYINIPRGQFLGLLLAWAVCPWKILYSAQTFTNFLGGYIIFMGSAVGVMVADYFVVTKGNVSLQHLYDGRSDNPHYYYHWGWNLQAYIAYVAGVLIPFPGFCGSLGANVSDTAMDLGHIGWCLSFVVGVVVYIALCYVWPTSNMKAMKGLHLQFEEMATKEFDPTTMQNVPHHLNDGASVIQGREVALPKETDDPTEDMERGQKNSAAVIVSEGSGSKELKEEVEKRSEKTEVSLQQEMSKSPGAVRRISG
jgi:NCS1 family nucleobase:cation symporter-1